MKKSYSLLGCLALSLVLALVFSCKPVRAAEPTTINLSDLEEGQKLEITEDSILNLDTDKTLSELTVNDCELTINGTATLTINGSYPKGLYGSGKITMNSGSLVSNYFELAKFELNDGTFKPNNVFVSDDNGYFTLNGGYFCPRNIMYYGKNASLNINGGHLESDESINSTKINISEKMFIVEPWNSEIYSGHKIYYGQAVEDISPMYPTSNCVRIIPKDEVIFLNNLSLSDSDLTLEIGETKQFSANFMPENAANKKVTWSSSDPSVAYIDINGLVTAYKSGTATITATSEDGDLTATCDITVGGADTNSEGLKIEISYFVWDSTQKIPYIKIFYNGVVIKEGFDYNLSNEYNMDNGLSTTTITGLDNFVLKSNK
ncbi:MAG: Ig-like domain-containing protein [Butyrivibrio sp.]|nr:Ig-like domain-containing protein [Butyrivibrio sp.]